MKTKTFKCDFCLKNYRVKVGECMVISYHMGKTRVTEYHSPHEGFCKKCLALFDTVGPREFWSIFNGKKE